MSTTTTSTPFSPTPSSSGVTSSRDTLLIVTSVAMGVATLALIFAVRILDRCTPSRRSRIRSEPRRRESAERRAERLHQLIDKQATRLPYGQWIDKKRNGNSSGEAAREDRAMSGKGSEQPSHVGVRKAPSTGSLRINATKSLSFSFSGHGLGGGPEDMPASGEGAGDDDSDWSCDCAICLGEFENDEMVCELKCGHIFHEECVHGWFVSSRKPRCPVCRMEVESNKDAEEGVEESSNTPEQSVSRSNDVDDGATYRMHGIGVF
ncbi:conserved hypothetical protein [Perkinsus marinus ATCC 50983]|uniref:RING-type domain-containing protein n=1 Tax=Perkinsus marinus (strain ATCC 50983 / TXsc) TaxID=423536 RepID=C5KHW8_PERM5|nr:conserved hypothetical protein [Perkinsus marinus ATCC 50983]EER16180.1 conserved hypothetical protein [Perkinsus marinus ATCC 50983]|eukprot:XP_002784384.1 conserved hypothetical protein [Perkinsus marinus ATCC 50983]